MWLIFPARAYLVEQRKIKRMTNNSWKSYASEAFLVTNWAPTPVRSSTTVGSQKSDTSITAMVVELIPPK